MPADCQLLLLWSNLHHINQAIRSALSRALEDTGDCSLIEHDLMSWLEVSGSRRPRMQDLAGLLDITPGGVTRLVDRLAERGWVIREQLPGNRIQTYAALTPAGTRALRTARTAYLQALRATLPAGMTADDLADLTDRTSRLLAELIPGDGRHPQPPTKHLPCVHRLRHVGDRVIPQES